MFILFVQGRRLNQGCSEKDYVISVGAGLCEIVELLTNQITCTPPLTKPELGVFYWQEDPVVKVGYLTSIVMLPYDSFSFCLSLSSLRYII